MVYWSAIPAHISSRTLYRLFTQIKCRAISDCFLCCLIFSFFYFVQYSCFVDVGPEPGGSADDLVGCGRGLGSCPPSQARGSCHLMVHPVQRPYWLDRCLWRHALPIPRAPHRLAVHCTVRYILWFWWCDPPPPLPPRFMVCWKGLSDEKRFKNVD